MGKFRLRLKLQGLEVEIDGEREDIPAITAALDSNWPALVPADRNGSQRRTGGLGLAHPGC